MAHTAIRIWIPGACHRVISPITLGGNKLQRTSEHSGRTCIQFSGKKGTECSVRPSSPGLTNNPPNPPPTRPPAHRSVVEVHGAKGRRNGRTSRGERDPSRDAYGAGSRLHGSRGSACQRIALGALCYRRLSQHDKPTPHRCSQRSSGAVGDLIAKDDAFFSFQERWLARQRPARRRQCSHCGPGWSHTGPFPG